jgi:hypothetical protein
MKKLFFACAITCSAFLTYAQTSFGVKAGGNLYNFTGKDADLIPGSKKLRVAYHFGGFANIHVSDMFSVQPELLYSAQGSKSSQGGMGHLTYQLDYIDVPVMFQYNNASGFFAEAGPEIGFLLSGKATNGAKSEDVKGYFKNINFSAGLGAGYICHNGFGVGARYNLGFSNIAEQSGYDLKDSGFRLSVIYVFGRAGKTGKAK